MQHSKIKATEGKNTPIMPIHFSPEQLLNMSEKHLLRIVLLYHETNAPKYGATKDIADVLKVETQTIGNYVAGRGQLGLDQLIVLFNHTGCGVIYDWVKARMKSFTEGE